MGSNLEHLTRRIQTLSDHQIAEVEDFVEFLRSRTDDRQIVRSAAALSSAALASVWDNPDDDLYNAL